MIILAEYKPFRALRPTPELSSKVAALPYDVMSSGEARETVKGNPYSFLHIDKAEIDLPADTYIYDAAVYGKAKENLLHLSEKGVLIQESEPMFYIYRQVMNGRSQTGLAGCAAVNDYIDGTIKKHEFTRADKEADRIRHVDICDANTGPIFLCYRKRDEINEIIEDWKLKNEPVYDFVFGGVAQTVWVVDNPQTCNFLSDEFSKVNSFYIADGHHRCASAVNVAKMRREQYPDYTGKEEFNFFLSVLFPADELAIMDYNRVIADLNDLSDAEFIEKVNENFKVLPYIGEGCYKPEKKHAFGMYLSGKWYALEAKAGTFDGDDPVRRLDVSILQDNLISPILGIDDPRTDKRIDFVGGIRGLSELEKRVNSDMRVAFSMYPATLDDLMAIADAGEVMPPKSTWFEPKLLSGLFIHKLSE